MILRCLIHIAGDIIKCILLKENFEILLVISFTWFFWCSIDMTNDIFKCIFMKENIKFDFNFIEVDSLMPDSQWSSLV